MQNVKEHIVYYSELSQIFKINELQSACENASLEDFISKNTTVTLSKDQLIYLHKGKLMETREGQQESTLDYTSG